VTNPTERARKDGGPWRLILDEGDGLEVRLLPPTGDPASDERNVELRLPPWRAYDLSRVLAAYSQMTALVVDATQVSSTEESLARALADASALATGREAAAPPASMIDAAARMKTMSLLQRLRPGFSHSKVVSIVDAAAWWLDNGKDFIASDLLEAVATEQYGPALYLTLLGRDPDDEIPIAGGESAR